MYSLISIPLKGYFLSTQQILQSIFCVAIPRKYLIRIYLFIMPVTDATIANLILEVKSISQRNYLQKEDAVAALREPAFEEFLIKINLGVALYSAQGCFFYVSQSLCRMIGYSSEMTYSKGPALLQQITTTHDRPLVNEILQQTEKALKKITHTVPYPRISFDFHILSGEGVLKRVYQHLLPNAVVHNKSYYTLFILHDFTGFKTSTVLNYHLSYLINEKFVTIGSGKVAPACPYSLTKSEKDLLKRLAEGKSMIRIASEKYISLDTLKKHRGNILRKTGDKNMVALLKDWLENGWLEK